MKKNLYIAPATEIFTLKAEQLLTASPLGTTNVEGLGVSTETYEEEGRSRSGSSLWDE